MRWDAERRDAEWAVHGPRDAEQRDGRFRGEGPRDAGWAVHRPGDAERRDGRFRGEGPWDAKKCVGHGVGNAEAGAAGCLWAMRSLQPAGRGLPKAVHS